MIKSNKSECLIDGRAGDVIFELNHIFHTLLTDNPEILIAVTTAWSPMMEREMNKTDESVLTSIYKVSSKLAEGFNDAE